MSRSSFNTSINKCISLLNDIGYMFQTGAGYSLDASSEFKKASRRALSYREVYDVGTKMQDFNLMLKDQSYFQFTETKEDEEIRLAYYPNPYKFIEFNKDRIEALDLLDNNKISQDEFDQLLSEEFTSLDVPVIRYDLSLVQYCENYHPAAHLHIGFFSENRWPVKRKLSPLSFLYMILMHYYPDVWKSIGDSGTSDPNILDVQYRNELSSCKSIDEIYFSKIETGRLYFD